MTLLGDFFCWFDESTGRGELGFLIGVDYSSRIEVLHIFMESHFIRPFTPEPLPDSNGNLVVFPRYYYGLDFFLVETRRAGMSS